MTEQNTSESNEWATREIAPQEARGKDSLPNAWRSGRLYWTPIPLYASFDQANSTSSPAVSASPETVRYSFANTVEQYILHR